MVAPTRTSPRHARRRPLGLAAGLLVGLLAGAPAQAGDEVLGVGRGGEPGGQGLAILTAKALVAEPGPDGRHAVDRAVILVRDGVIEAVAAQDELVVPAGYAVLDVGPNWVAPGFIDLHSHVGGTRQDINDMVFQTNPGLRTAPTVIAANDELDLASAAGVTTVLYIPGSGTNIGGQGILMRTTPETYEASVIRDPGSMKLAQGDNPVRWGFRMGRIMMAWNLRQTLSRGVVYARRWLEHEADGTAKPYRDVNLDIFRDLVARKTQISTHTQYYHLVLTTIVMLARDYGFATYIDHGSFDSYLTTPLAMEQGVDAILGPREVMWPTPPRFDTDGKVIGTAWGFQQMGHPTIGFNTDAPVVPQAELPLQAAMGARYGMDDSRMETVRGITSVPAKVAGIDHLLGSLRPGLQADLLVVTGDPVDPRCGVEMVFTRGELVYDTRAQRRRW